MFLRRLPPEARMSEPISCRLVLAPAAPPDSGDRTKRPELSLLKASVRLPFVLGPALELDIYLIGEESARRVQFSAMRRSRFCCDLPPPIVCPEARGVRPPSLGAADCCRKGELIPMPLLPFVVDLFIEPFAGEDWKKRGDEVRAF